MNTHLITLAGEAVTTFKPSSCSIRDVKREAIEILHRKGYLALSEFRVWRLVGIGWNRKKPTKRAIKARGSL